MHEQITNLGWAWHGYCNCGIKGKVYRKGDYKLTHFFEHRTWQLKQRVRNLERGTDDNLIEKITGL